MTSAARCLITVPRYKNQTLQKHLSDHRQHQRADSGRPRSGHVTRIFHLCEFQEMRVNHCSSSDVTSGLIICPKQELLRKNP